MLHAKTNVVALFHHYIYIVFSRQRYVLGDGAMQKLAKANVLIIGLGGVGVEVGK